SSALYSSLFSLFFYARSAHYLYLHFSLHDALPISLAWSIGTITSELGTADYLVDFAKNTTSPVVIPALLFIFGSIIAFTTGTSYGTFAIMIPIAMPLAHSLDMSMAMTIA